MKRENRITPEVREHLEQLIKSAVNWLDSTQPTGALIQHHGIYTDAGFLYLSFAPVGFQLDPVVVFDIADKERKYNEYHELTNGFTRQEVAALAEIVAAVTPVHSTWNGVTKSGFGLATFSVRLTKVAGTDMGRLVATYHKGCPIHPTESVFCHCGWFAKGRERVVFPEKWWCYELSGLHTRAATGADSRGAGHVLRGHHTGGDAQGGQPQSGKTQAGVAR